MAAGLIVYNNDYKIQIDSAFVNLHLSRKITLSGTGVTSGTFAQGEFLAAVGGVASQNVDAICVNSPSGWTCTVRSFTAGMCVYVFSTKPTASAHGVGLQVFDDNGNIVYDSNDKHPVVAGFGNADGAPFKTATKPAMAVCQNRRTVYNQVQYEHIFESEYESRQVYHDAVYGWVDEEYETFEYVDAVYEWVAGHYETQYVAGHYETQYVAPTYQYNWQTGQYELTGGGYQQVWVPGGYEQVWVPAEYVLVTPAHTEFVTKTRSVYKEITPGYWETIWEWVYYWSTYETEYYFYNETNFLLQNGSVVSNTISEGTTGHSERRLYSKESAIYGQQAQNEVYWGSYYYPTSVVVDTRSWLLLDVNGL